MEEEERVILTIDDVRSDGVVDVGLGVGVGSQRASALSTIHSGQYPTLHTTAEGRTTAGGGGGGAATHSRHVSFDRGDDDYGEQGGGDGIGGGRARQ